jgi:hypothetical protein
MNSSTTKLTLAIMLGAIASLVVAGVGVASVNADINNPRNVIFKDTSKVIINLPSGKDGKNGHDGTDGKDGTDGVNGIDGVNGLNGTNGSDGLNGLNGTNGVDGQNGKDGVNGTNGSDGAPGINGTNGQNGRDGINGTNGVDGVNGVDGKDASATIFINTTQGQQILCSVGPNATIGCQEVVADNGTVVIPPITNDTGTGGNTTEPVVCAENETNVNGTCVANLPPIDDNTTIPPVDNGTVTNDTGGVIPPVDNGTLPVDNGTTVFDNGTVTNENGTSVDTNDTGNQ